MQKLRVLADPNSGSDGQEHSAPAKQYKRIPHGSDSKKCCPKNQNHNNVNVNFGTNVERSHNPQHSSHNTGRAVDGVNLPMVQPIWKTYQQPQNTPPIVQPIARPMPLPASVVRPFPSPDHNVIFNPNPSSFSRQMVGNMIGQLPHFSFRQSSCL